MSLFNDASLVMIPSGYKEDVVYSVKPTDGSGDLTFTRASTATRVNSSGNIESVSTGVPRLDYSSGGCPSLLLEPQRTNSFTYSESFANYYSNRATKTDLGTPSIFSSGSIARFTATSGNSFFGKYTFTLTAGSVYTLSAFFDITEGIYAGISDGSNYRIFNISTGSVVGSGVGTLTINCTSTQIGTSNYYRVAFTFTATLSASHYFIIGTSSGTNSTTNETVAAGYFQREDSASYPTSYIPTTSASVTRVADAASKTGISSLIGQSEGTVFVEYDQNLISQSATRRIFALNDGTTSNRITAYINSANGIDFYVRNSGGDLFYAQASAPIGNTKGLHKIAAVYKDGDYAVYFDGSLIISGAGTAGTIPACSRFDLGNQLGISDLYEPIKQAILFKTRLSNTDLASLTTL